MKHSLKNTAKIEHVIDRVQEKSKSRFFSLNDIIYKSEIAEKELISLGLPKKLLPGARYVSGHEHFPNAYKYTPYGTIIALTRGVNGWYLTRCDRSICNMPGNNGLKLTDAQRVYLKAKIDKTYL